MTTLNKRPVIAAVLALACLFLAEAGFAGSAGARIACNYCYNHLGGHNFIGRGCPQGHFGCMDCAAFNACHGDMQEGGCTQFHFSCQGSSAMNDVLQAVDRHDAGALAALVDGGESVRYNADRGALQVTDCTGAVIVHLPLTLDQVAAD